MNRRTLSVLVLFVAVAAIMLLPACITDTEDPSEKKIKSDEPPDDPPPPPPPPPYPSSLNPYVPTMETIAGDVLQGAYGPQLQRLLADEVSVCLNTMIGEDMVAAWNYSGGVELERLESDTREISYSDHYLIQWILEGRYGDTARINLHSFIRSIDNTVLVF